MCNEQTIQQTDFANQLITKQAAIDALGEKPLVWDDLSDFDLGKAAQWSDDVDAIKALPSAQPQWIPVTERLPEYGTEVVTINKDDEYEINHVIDEEDGEWFFDGAVAWMPLPEPYKGEQG